MAWHCCGAAPIFKNMVKNVLRFERSFLVFNGEKRGNIYVGCPNFFEMVRVPELLSWISVLG